MTREEFDRIVEQAITALPERFARHLENIEIVVEDEPSREVLLDLGLDPRRDTLFGLYEGVPIDERADALLPLPDRIFIYYRPLIRTFRTPKRIQREIERTVLHEIGHVFGLDDDEMDE